jgi:hypothetical protein
MALESGKEVEGNSYAIQFLISSTTTNIFDKCNPNSGTLSAETLRDFNKHSASDNALSTNKTKIFERLRRRERRVLTLSGSQITYSFSTRKETATRAAGLDDESHQ